MSRNDLTDSVDGDFVVVSKKVAVQRSVSDALSQWTMIGDTRSGDEISGCEDNVGVETSLVKSQTFERSQLYLLIARCISYPFSAKYQLENSLPKQKMTEERLKQISKTLNSTLAGERLRYQDLTPSEQRKCTDPKFLECLHWFVTAVLDRDDIINVCRNGSFSAKELIAIFRVSFFVSHLHSLFTSMCTGCTMYLSLSACSLCVCVYTIILLYYITTTICSTWRYS